MSFSDMMQSARGPGVIGMIMALVVILGFGLLFMFAFDEGMQGGDKSIESVIAHQTAEIDGTKEAILRGGKKTGEAPLVLAAAKELTALKRENQSRDAKIGGLKQDVATAADALAAKSKEFEGYKDVYRAFVRGKAKGQMIGRLESLKGTVYENATIREVTAIGVQIRHDGGFKRIPFEELPMEMQDHFQFDPKQKAEALANEESARKEHEGAVSAANAAVSEQAAEQRIKNAEAAREQAIRAIAMKESRMESLSDEIKQLQEAIVLEGKKTISRAPQMRAQLASKQQEAVTLREEVSRMRAGL
jgi:hypothetical protein